MIKEGSVTCTNIDGATNNYSRVLSSGDHFGEMSLINNSLRGATVVANSDTLCFLLHEKDFHKILGSMGDALEHSQICRTLASVPFFSELMEPEVNALANAMTVKKFSASSQINDFDQQYYVIKNGNCISKDSSGKTSVLTRGDFFTSDSVNSTTDSVCTCYSLSHGALYRCIGWRYTVAKYVSKNLEKTHETIKLVPKNKIQKSIPIKNLKKITCIGEGTFGLVNLVSFQNDSYYILKDIVKYDVVENMQEANVLAEKKTMQLCNHPFIIKMIGSYTDRYHASFLLEFCQGGELSRQIYQSSKIMLERSVKFYASCIIMALEHMHSLNIAHRDLKPDNVMITSNGYCKLIDLGLAKIVKDKTYTLCGTPSYFAPEMILAKGYNFAVDYWALGVLIYEMFLKETPFFQRGSASDRMQEFRNILVCSIKYPIVLSDETIFFLQQLLERNPSNRLGNTIGGVCSIYNSKWLKDVCLDNILHQQSTAPWIPHLNGPEDTSNFPLISCPKKKVKPPKCRATTWDSDF